MDWKLELVAVPVSDVDRAKTFYTDRVGFNADHDHRVSDEVRFVQLTPPGSACSIASSAGSSWRRNSICRSKTARLSVRRESKGTSVIALPEFLRERSSAADGAIG